MKSTKDYNLKNHPQYYNPQKIMFWCIFFLALNCFRIREVIFAYVENLESNKKNKNHLKSHPTIVSVNTFLCTEFT